MTVALSTEGHSGSQHWSFATPGSGFRIVVTTPHAAPDLWRRYLTEAEESYAAHGVAGALDLEGIRDGRSTSLFFAGFAPDGALVGGVRVQGPYARADQAHALTEWGHDPGRAQVQRMISDRVPHGVVEVKAAWVASGFPGRRELVGCLARTPLHAAMILGARFALVTSAVHALPMWTGSGGVPAEGLSPVGYPDDRYRTTVMWWDRWALPDTVSEVERRTLDLETAQLLAPIATAA